MLVTIWLSHILEVGRESRRRVATRPVCKELLALGHVIAKDWLSCHRQNKGDFGGHESFGVSGIINGQHCYSLEQGL